MHRTSRPRRREGPSKGASPPQMRHEEGGVPHEAPALPTDAVYRPVGAEAALASKRHSASQGGPMEPPGEVPFRGSDPSGLRQCRATVRLLELLQRKEDRGAPYDASEGQQLARCKSATESSCSVASADTCASSSQSEHSHVSEEDMCADSPPDRHSNRQLQRQVFYALLQQRMQQLRLHREESMRQYQLLQEQYRRQHPPLLQQQRQEPPPQQFDKQQHRKQQQQQQQQQQVFCDLRRSSSWSPPYSAVLSVPDSLQRVRRGSEEVSALMGPLHSSRSVPAGGASGDPQRAPAAGGKDPFAASVFMRCPDASAIPLPASLLS